MKSKLHRAFWLFMVILFVTTALGVGIYGFWQATHTPSSPSSTTPVSSLKGTQLANFTPVAHIDTLQAVDTKAGTGDEAKAGNTVTVIYSGAVADTGIIFDTNADTGQPASLKLDNNSVIAGWVQGVPGMNEGGERRLLIPANLG